MCSSAAKSQIPLRYLVADNSEAGRRPAASWNLPYHYLASSELARASRSATGPRPASNQLRTCLRPGSLSGSKLVRSWSRTCRIPVSSCQFAASKLCDMPNFSSLQVCDQLRTSFEPDSVMEFGLQWSVIITASQLSHCNTCCLITLMFTIDRVQTVDLHCRHIYVASAWPMIRALTQNLYNTVERGYFGVRQRCVGYFMNPIFTHLFSCESQRRLPERNTILYLYAGITQAIFIRNMVYKVDPIQVGLYFTIYNVYDRSSRPRFPRILALWQHSWRFLAIISLCMRKNGYL